MATSQKVASDDTVVGVRSVVLGARGSKEATEAIRPLRMTDLTTDYQDLNGTVFEGAGMVAVFPLSGLPANPEVRVLFDQIARGSAAVSRCRECIVPLNMDRVG